MAYNTYEPGPTINPMLSPDRRARAERAQEDMLQALAAEKERSMAAREERKRHPLHVAIGRAVISLEGSTLE